MTDEFAEDSIDVPSYIEKVQEDVTSILQLVAVIKSEPGRLSQSEAGMITACYNLLQGRLELAKKRGFDKELELILAGVLNELSDLITNGNQAGV